jgi:hypothetical protein
MRDLAIFGAFWVASIIMTVEILHPIIICYLPAPTEHEHFLPGFMVRFTRAVGNATTHPRWKYVIGAFTIILLSSSTYVALFHSKIGMATTGTPLLWPDHEWNLATDEIAQRFGGVASMVVFSDGDRQNASADPDPIRAMERFERHLKKNTDLGAAVSLVPFLRSSWMINHYGDPKWYFIPAHPGTVRAMIFQFRQNGPPGFLRPYMTDDGRKANVAFYYKDQKGDTIEYARHYAEEFIEANPLGEVSVRLDMDRAEPHAKFFDRQNLLDMWYYMIGPLLPPRNHTLNVRIRQEDGSYQHAPVTMTDGDDAPEWMEGFREAAVSDYEDERYSTEDEGEYFTWPDTLADWDVDDVDAWWENEEFGIRAVAVNTKDLIVHDLKAVDGGPDRPRPQGGGRGAQVPAHQLLDARRPVRDGGRHHGHPGRRERGGRAEPRGEHLADLLRDLRAPLRHVPVDAQRRDHLPADRHGDDGVAGLHGASRRGAQHQHAAGAVGRQEVVDTADIDEAVRRAVRTTGMAVSFTATTVVGGIVLWVFSSLRFQAEMAYLLVILMILNMFGAITIVPAFYSILRPKVATALLTDEQRELIRAQKEREKQLGLRDANE